MVTESVSGASGDPTGAIVVVTGSAGALGQAVCALVAADPSVASVVAIDQRPTPAIDGISTRTIDLASADLKPLFEGAAAVLHLAQADDGAPTNDAGLTHRVLDAAGAAGVTHVVLLSSAAAYGAWANNPVPLTEDAALRPNPGVAVLSAKAEMERAAAEFRDDHPGTTVTLLRPTLTVASGRQELARSRAVPLVARADHRGRSAGAVPRRGRPGRCGRPGPSGSDRRSPQRCARRLDRRRHGPVPGRRRVPAPAARAGGAPAGPHRVVVGGRADARPTCCRSWCIPGWSPTTV